MCQPIDLDGYLSLIATDIFAITVPATAEGGYTCIMEGHAELNPNLTVTADMSVKSVFTHTNANDGTSATGAVTEVYQTAVAETVAGSRTIAAIDVTALETSATILTVQAVVTYTGASKPNMRFRVTVMWDTYNATSVLAAS